MTVWSDSGSRRSPRAVESTMSVNTTVTVLSAWLAADASALAAPQAGQNLAPGGVGAPHRPHVLIDAEPIGGSTKPVEGPVYVHNGCVEKRIFGTENEYGVTCTFR